MAAEPSIKGAAIKTLVTDVQQLLESEVLSLAEARARLSADELDLLDAGVLDSAWYPIDSWRRLTEIVRDHLGGNDPVAYLQGRGQAVAERLIALGVYQQMDFLQRTGSSRNVEIAVQNLKLTATLWNSFFNFGSWGAAADPGDVGTFYMEVRDGGPIPEVGWLAVHGCMTGLSRAAGGGRGGKVLREDRADGSVIFRFKAR